MSVHDILDTLNPEQREAVEYFDSPLLIIAGAGTGKTRVITHKIAFAIHNKMYFPSEIFAATFTNKAAAEMKARVEKILQPLGRIPFNIGTFHSLCAKILRHDGDKIGIDRNYTIIDDHDQESIIKQIINSNSEYKVYSQYFKKPPQPSVILAKIGGYKIKLLTPEMVKKEAGNEEEFAYGVAYEEYQKKLQDNNALDFDDLIGKAILLFLESQETLQNYKRKFKYILVDEYQDTNHQQFELVRLLAADSQKICVVGDEDQSIYSWRGADISNILDFRDKFDNVKIIKLEKNYRSTQNILNAANEVIQHNKERIGKTLVTDHEAGSKIYVVKLENEHDEADYVARRIIGYNQVHGIRYSDMAVFCRTNALTRSPETQFRMHKIPHRVIGAIRFYERSEVKDLLSYLRLLANPNNDIAFTRIINKPKRGLGPKALSQLEECAKNNRKSMFESLCDVYEFDGMTKSKLKSIEDFLGFYAKWKSQRDQMDLLTLTKMIIRDIEYEDFLKKAYDGDEAESKLDNVNEFINAIAEFCKSEPDGSLEDFLERITLISSQDEMTEPQDAVPIMTIHCAKGLEFSVVFIIGMEEPIFPNSFAVMNSGQFEEERRLFYVAMTRAMKKLYITHTLTRFYKGESKWFKKSCFLREIPHKYISIDDDKEFKMKIETETEETEKAPPAEIRTVEDGKFVFPVGSRVNHTENGTGTVIGYKMIAAKPAIKVYFDRGFERTIHDTKSLRKVD